MTDANRTSTFGYADDAFGRIQFGAARYYDPKIVRFISEDPIGFDGGPNFYTHVQNNPSWSLPVLRNTLVSALVIRGRNNGVLAPVSAKRREECCKIKRVNPRLPLRVHSAVLE